MPVVSAVLVEVMAAPAAGRRTQVAAPRWATARIDRGGFVAVLAGSVRGHPAVAAAPGCGPCLCARSCSGSSSGRLRACGRIVRGVRRCGAASHSMREGVQGRGGRVARRSSSGIGPTARLGAIRADRGRVGRALAGWDAPAVAYRRHVRCSRTSPETCFRSDSAYRFASTTLSVGCQ